MARKQRVSETINRGLTAAAMTIAIATIYAAVTADSRVSDSLVNPLETVLDLPGPKVKATQQAQDSQESLGTLLLSSRGRIYGN